MLRLENIAKGFSGIAVLTSLSCHVDRGDFVIIMGPNAAGKSTLFDLISGKTTPDQGRISIEEVDITHQPERKRVHLVGRLFQNTYLGSCSNLTIRENLAMATLKGRQAGFKLGVR